MSHAIHGQCLHALYVSSVHASDEHQNKYKYVRYVYSCTREGSLRSLFKSVFYPPKCENMVKMSDARIFFHFFLERRLLRFHRGIVHPPAAIIDRATRADWGVETPPLIGYNSSVVLSCKMARTDVATRIESARNFCLEQPKKVFAFHYGNFEKSKSRGGMHYDCRPCRPKHAGRVLWVNAQTCKKPYVFENGPEARETLENALARELGKNSREYTLQRS